MGEIGATILKTAGIGLGTVFVGLICLIFITKLMSALCSGSRKQPQAKAAPALAAQAAVPEIADRGAFSAAVAACIATVMDTKADGIRIVSIKKAK